MASVNFNPAAKLQTTQVTQSVKTVAPKTIAEKQESTPAPQGDGLQIDFGTALKQATVVKTPEAEVKTAASPPAPATEQAPMTLTIKAGTSVQMTTTGALMEFAPDISATRSVTPGDLNFNKGADVISSAKKFILPAPKFADGGEPLVYPDGTKNSKGEDVSGKPIADYKGDPIGDRGVVFYNPKDQAWEGVTGDGNGVVIFNQLKDEQSQAILDKVATMGGDPTKLNLEQFKDVIQTAANNGCDDRYHSDRDFIKGKMNPLESSTTGIPEYGLFRRDDRDVCNVVFVEGAGEFTGTATTHKFDDGAVILRQANAKTEGGFDFRLIQPDVFKETYSNKDGSKISLDELPRG